MKFTPTQLILEDGTLFEGYSPNNQKGDFFGEVVFNTGMTGYVETLTDPSYAGQILTFTYPLIGNYGVPGKQKWESKKIHPRGVVISEACLAHSHSEAKYSLLEWLKEQNIPVIIGVDTRALTKKLRESGVMLGAISSQVGSRQARTINKSGFDDPNKENLVSQVTIAKKKDIGMGKKKIIAVDCGMKENIVRCLSKFPLTISRVPYDYDYTTEKFDGIFISNGPGDPKMAGTTIKILKKAMKQKKPTFGICLGSQIMGLAAGGKTYKLPYGHRGHNQPCKDIKSGQCVITSQNHGYAVKQNSLPKDWYVNFRNLNDGTAEGVAHKKLPFFSVQFHPEATPGPTDSEWMFEKFYKIL